MNIRVIEAQKPSVKKKKLRVAAYCRVSTDNTDQLESLETQKSHYESLIQLHTEWENAGLYYDTGITGTKADIREGLQNLLTACRIGKVDLILVKSISRLSRNTTDCLSIVRELINIGVTIFFEKENINTAEMESELILSILSSMAEEESASISKNEKWSVQRRMAAGIYKMPYVPYGYQRDNNGNMIIEQNEAGVVKYIFNAVLAGQGTDAIAAALSDQHIPTRKGGNWSGSTVRDIIANEKYTGDALFQKTYTDDTFRRHNNGSCIADSPPAADPCVGRASGADSTTFTVSGSLAMAATRIRCPWTNSVRLSALTEMSESSASSISSSQKPCSTASRPVIRVSSCIMARMSSAVFPVFRT